MRTKPERAADAEALPRRRAAALTELRLVLSDLGGLAVGRVSFRTGRMIIWLRPRDAQEPVLALKLRRLVAFRDNGIGGTGLVHGGVVEGGAFGRNLAESDDTPEYAKYLQLDLWNSTSKAGPAFQALAKDIRVYQGDALSPDRIWKS